MTFCKSDFFQNPSNGSAGNINNTNYPEIIEFDYDLDKGEDFSTAYKRSKILSILNEHNKYRALHQVNELKLDDDLSYEAEQWAEHLARYGAETKHRVPFGRNVWIKKTKRIYAFMNADSLNPVKEWYQQINNYPGYINLTTYIKTKGFTQVVWKSSKRLGVGIAYSVLRFCVVCYYYPPGNVISSQELFSGYADWKYQRNVLPTCNASWMAKVPISYEPDKTVLLFLFCVALTGFIIFLNYREFIRITDETGEE